MRYLPLYTKFCLGYPVSSNARRSDLWSRSKIRFSLLTRKRLGIWRELPGLFWGVRYSNLLSQLKFCFGLPSQVLSPSPAVYCWISSLVEPPRRLSTLDSVFRFGVLTRATSHWDFKRYPFMATNGSCSQMKWRLQSRRHESVEGSSEVHKVT